MHIRFQTIIGASNKGISVHFLSSEIIRGDRIGVWKLLVLWSEAFTNFFKKSRKNLDFSKYCKAHQYVKDFKI